MQKAKSTSSAKKKPKVDNRTKWRRRLAIGLGHGGANDLSSGSLSDTLPAQNYVAVGISAAEAKKVAQEQCVLVYVPPKRTAAEAKLAAEELKAKIEAAKKKGLPMPSNKVFPGQESYALDKNGKPALAPGQHVDKDGMPIEGPPTHRASCHRCGNLRRKILVCKFCPHVFCLKCGEKMFEEHGADAFKKGCVVCREICCCGINRSEQCTRKFHCYKKCPTMKKTQKKRPKGGANKTKSAASSTSKSGNKPTKPNESIGGDAVVASQNKLNPPEGELSVKNESSSVLEESLSKNTNNLEVCEGGG